MPSLEGPTLDNTVGALLLGLVGSAFLYGVTTLQAYWYYHCFHRDSLLHKCSVSLLWALDTFHLALTIHAVYLYVVTGFGNLDGLLHVNKGERQNPAPELILTRAYCAKVQVAINVVVILLVQSLYTYRVWILGGYHRGLLGYFVIAVVSGGFAIGIILAYQIFTVVTYKDLDGVSWAINASLATSTAIDFMIAGAMCFYLRKSKGSQTRLNSRISRMMQYTLSSGLFTSACSLSAMFSYILLPDTFVYLGIQFILTKLYVGSFFAMLNARERPREPKGDTENSYATPLRVQLHSDSSFQSPSLPSTLPDTSRDAGVMKTYPW
ncbi:hypothetical protein D9615_007877 [Tricholomella constricta]|uniref:DUF6534 domain-containing protein n=1 Tax=Tricholomella constricta TaxID=117010 RepID=A0A8H5M0T0_9AGAR|nr:hypothetical protein D9615_007877 [Tricholomella constricta]